MIKREKESEFPASDGYAVEPRPVRRGVLPKRAKREKQADEQEEDFLKKHHERTIIGEGRAPQPQEPA